MRRNTPLVPVLVALAALLAGCSSAERDAREHEPAWKEVIPSAAARLAESVGSWSGAEPGTPIQIVLPVKVEYRSSEAFDRDLYVAEAKRALEQGGRLKVVDAGQGAPLQLLGRAYLDPSGGRRATVLDLTVVRKGQDAPVAQGSGHAPWGGSGP